MVVVFLVLLALAGGCAGTFFLMDAPRRRARERLEEIERDRRALDADRDEFDREARRLEERKRTLSAATAACDRRAAELAARESDYNRRVVAYEELAAENRILRAELKNAVVHAAYLEQAQHANRSGASAAGAQRDALGRAYFDEVAASARKSLTPANYPSLKQRVRNAADRVREEGGGLPPAEEDRALAELHALFERAVRASVEREEQARLREQIREEQARQREVEEAVEQADREQAAVAAALERALAAAAGKHAEEVGKHAAEIEALRLKLAEAEAKSQRAVSEAQLTKAGHVYGISNVGSFGPGVFKLGMTRRRDPMDRVHELGDASVPFPFDVHLMIKCEDAPALEAALHKHFRDRRVNRVNLRKEFFRVTIDEVVAAVREHHGEVEYVADAAALEFLASRDATGADVEEIEEAYAEAEAEVGRHGDGGAAAPAGGVAKR